MVQPDGPAQCATTQASEPTQGLRGTVQPRAEGGRKNYRSMYLDQVSYGALPLARI